MKLVVHKHILGGDHGTYIVKLKAGAFPIDVGFQTSPLGMLQLVLWEYHDADFTEESERKFVALYTGEAYDMPDNFRYVATAQVHIGAQPFVVHVFEESSD